MNLRTATLEDLPEIRRIFRAASLSNAGDRQLLLDNPAALDFSPESVVNGRTRLAIGDSGDIQGFATAVPLGENVELDDLFVDPVHMRRGIATRLIEDVVDGARSGGAAAVCVTANDHAMAFYLSAGFLPDGWAQTEFGPAQRLRLPIV